MEREELVQRLNDAYPLLDKLEDISEVCDQCSNGFYENQRKRRKARITIFLTIAAPVFLFFVGGGGATFEDFLSIAGICGIIILIAFLFQRRYSKQMQGFSENFTQYQEHFQELLEKNHELIDFIPDVYQSTFAVSYFIKAVQSGAAKDMNEAIQQFLIYSGNMEKQQAIRDQTRILQQELQSIRDEIY